MKMTSYSHVRDLVSLCAQHGLKHAIISPGSRSAPLVIGFEREKSIQCISIVDERSAAFFALGIAQQSQSPVVLICTSGSALLNYAPAIAESYYQRIPLLILSADRPPEWMDQQDGQMINQVNVFQNLVEKSFHLPCAPLTPTQLWQCHRSLNEAVLLSKIKLRPVHINIPFDEPLYEQEEIIDNKTVKPFCFTTFNERNGIDWNKLNIEIGAFKKVMLVGGSGSFVFPSKDSNGFESIVLLSEVNCNISGVENFSNLDVLIAGISEEENKHYSPDLLITFGGSIVSKKLKFFLRKNPPKAHWHLSKHLEMTDTFQCLSRILDCSVEDLALVFRNKTGTHFDLSFFNKWKILNEKVQQKTNAYISQAPFSDLKVFDLVFKNIPDNYQIHLANSTPVRYASFFSTIKKYEVYCNRGVSGIDGCTDTAAGASFYSQKNTLLITGEIAFLHNSNALWNFRYTQKLKVIVINNDGGNIFTLINQKSRLPELQEFFETPAQVNIQQLVTAYGIPHYYCKTEQDLINNLPLFLSEQQRACVLEIKTDKTINAEIYKGLFDSLKN